MWEKVVCYENSVNTLIYENKKGDAERAAAIVKYFSVIKRKLAFCMWAIAEDPESIYSLRKPTENIAGRVLYSKSITQVFPRFSHQGTQRSLQLPEGNRLHLKLSGCVSVTCMQEFQGQRGLHQYSRKSLRAGNVW